MSSRESVISCFYIYKEIIVDKLDVQPKKGHSFFIEKIHNYNGMIILLENINIENYGEHILMFFINIIG